MYDVGANTGFYSALVGRLSPTTVVRAFEPIPAIADFARENLAIAGLDVDRVTLEQAALSDRPGTAELFLPPEIPGRIESSASLLSDFKPTVVESVTAATETLDGANERFSGERVGLIKIDVEDDALALDPVAWVDGLNPLLGDTARLLDAALKSDPAATEWAREFLSYGPWVEDGPDERP